MNSGKNGSLSVLSFVAFTMDNNTLRPLEIFSYRAGLPDSLFSPLYKDIFGPDQRRPYSKTRKRMRCIVNFDIWEIVPIALSKMLDAVSLESMKVVKEAAKLGCTDIPVRSR